MVSSLNPIGRFEVILPTIRIGSPPSVRIKAFVRNIANLKLFKIFATQIRKAAMHKVRQINPTRSITNISCSSLILNLNKLVAAKIALIKV
jgi:hypothetical protein